LELLNHFTDPVSIFFLFPFLTLVHYILGSWQDGEGFIGPRTSSAGLMKTGQDDFFSGKSTLPK
jgi:hypothetical protein